MNINKLINSKCIEEYIGKYGTQGFINFIKPENMIYNHYNELYNEMVKHTGFDYTPDCGCGAISYALRNEKHVVFDEVQHLNILASLGRTSGITKYGIRFSEYNQIHLFSLLLMTFYSKLETSELFKANSNSMGVCGNWYTYGGEELK